jgi:hypothetical protein
MGTPRLGRTGPLAGSGGPGRGSCGRACWVEGRGCRAACGSSGLDGPAVPKTACPRTTLAEFRHAFRFRHCRRYALVPHRQVSVTKLVEAW